MSPTRRYPLALVLAVIVLGFGVAPASAQLPCGLLTPCQPPPAQPAPPAGEGPPQFIGLEIKNPDIVSGEAVVFEGVFLPSDYPNPHRIELVASRWPFAGGQVVAATVASGRFSFSHTPELNTRYYARSDDLDPAPGNQVALSTVQLVRVYAELRKFKVKVVGPRKVRMRFAADFPDQYALPLARRRIHWYIERDGRKSTQVGTSRTKANEATKVMRGKIRARMPRGSYRFRGAFCVNLAVGVDTGVGDPQPKRCP